MLLEVTSSTSNGLFDDPLEKVLQLERKKDIMKISRILLLAVSLSLAFSFIASSAEQPSGRSITLGDLTFSNHGTKEVKGQGELDLEADNYYFEPTFLRGTPGQKLKVEIENESGTLHNFTIPDQHLDVNIPPKGKVIVEITFPSSGVVRFFCKFHSAKGMNGELLTGDAKPQAVRSPK
jgi:plastocyanin